MSIHIGRGGISMSHGATAQLSSGAAYPDEFDRDDGALGAPWLGGETWQIVSGKAVNTPTLGDELLTNGDMEDGDPPTSWIAVSSTATLSAVAEERAGGAGAQSLQVARTANTTAGAFQGATSVVQNQWHRLSGWTRASNAVDAYLRMYTGAPVLLGTSAKNATTTWAENVVTARSPITSLRAYINATTSAELTSALFDDISLKPITLASLFNVVNAGLAHVDVSTAATIIEGTQAGLVVCLDNLTTPANFIIGYHDGTKAVLEKCVAGTYTTLISETIAYSAGASVRVVKRGTDCKLYYNNSQVGADQTVSDAGIVNNNYHGLFSTHSGNTFDDFQMAAFDFV